MADGRSVDGVLVSGADRNDLLGALVKVAVQHAEALRPSVGEVEAARKGLAAGVEVVLAEHDPSGPRSPAAWVAANLQASTDAVTHASRTKPLTVGDLCCWHSALMAGSPTPAEHVGHVRTIAARSQGVSEDSFLTLPATPDTADGAGIVDVTTYGAL
ncbi:MAG: hypothetical protein ACYCO3_02330 [Mycobacteriales bacterium]